MSKVHKAKGVRDTGFYSSSRWKITRDSIKRRDQGVCQRCGQIVVGRGIVDHIIELTDFEDDLITYGEDNLQYLCQRCHNVKTFGSVDSIMGREVDWSKRSNPPSIDIM